MRPSPSTGEPGLIARAFARGLVVLVPIAITVGTVLLVAAWVDGLIPVDLDSDPNRTLFIPGLGVAIIVALVFAVGALASYPLIRAAVRGIDALIARVPIVRMVHASLKDLTGALVGANRHLDKPVVVTLSATGGGAKLIGYITADDLGAEPLDGYVAVYFPQAYNFAGQLVLFSRDQVCALDAASSDVMTFIVSGGVSGSLAPPGADHGPTTQARLEARDVHAKQVHAAEPAKSAPSPSPAP